MSVVPADLRFAFQPLLNLQTGSVVAVEALARPRGSDIRTLLREARSCGRLSETDVGLAIAALRAAAEGGSVLPLHVNLLACTAAQAHVAIGPLVDEIRATGRSSREIVLEISPPFSGVPPKKLLRGLNILRGEGFRIAFDGVGDGDVPLTMIADAAPDIIKLDRRVTIGADDRPGRKATVEAIVHLCREAGTQIIAEGVETAEQLAEIRAAGIRFGQGHLLGAPARRPPAYLSVAGLIDDLPAVTETTGELARLETKQPHALDLMQPAVTRLESCTADEVRTLLAASPTLNSVVLVDNDNRPLWTIDRNRFLLSVTGPYGHALHAKRHAVRLADKPRIVTHDDGPAEVLSMLASDEAARASDDVVVVDDDGCVVGVVRAIDLIRGMADAKIEQAAALHPLTRLPGAESIRREIDLRVRSADLFALSWLDVNSFSTINDELGFAAGDELIRGVGKDIRAACAALKSVHPSHVSRDDFLIISDLDDIVPLAERLVDTARAVGDRSVTVSMATIVRGPGINTDYAELSAILANLRRRAKAIPTSSWVVGRLGTDKIDILRGRPTLPSANRQPHRAVS